MRKQVKWSLPALLIVILMLSYAPEAKAKLQLARLFTDHAVLQAGMEVPIWGTAAPETDVRVTLDGKTARCTADADGHWKATFDTLKVGGPHKLVVETGKGNRTAVMDVMVGEVWLASGQSNMVMPVHGSRSGKNAIRKGKDSHIRFFQVKESGAENPRNRLPGGSWALSNPDNVPDFSAVAYYFARSLRERLDVPVGIIQSAYSGSRVQEWIPREAFVNAEPALGPDVEEIKKLARKHDVKLPNKVTGQRYNPMIAPLVPYAFRGTIWYQGEANTHKNADASRYEEAFSTLIRKWRAEWNRDFPFLFVQLPAFKGRSPHWMRVQEEQRLTHRKLDNTAMIVTLDVGNPQNIHPRRKQPVGNRLALAALAKVYGRNDVAWSGPLAKKAEALEDGKVAVRFSHVYDGLKVKGEALTGFEVQNKDDEWKDADAELSGNRVIVSSPEVSRPQAVRYAWAEVPTPCLVNQAGLPASPFTLTVSR